MNDYVVAAIAQRMVKWATLALAIVVVLLIVSFFGGRASAQTKRDVGARWALVGHAHSDTVFPERWTAEEQCHAAGRRLLSTERIDKKGKTVMPRFTLFSCIQVSP